MQAFVNVTHCLRFINQDLHRFMSETHTLQLTHSGEMFTGGRTSGSLLPEPTLEQLNASFITAVTFKEHAEI